MTNEIARFLPSLPKGALALVILLLLATRPLDAAHPVVGPERLSSPVTEGPAPPVPGELASSSPVATDEGVVLLSTAAAPPQAPPAVAPLRRLLKKEITRGIARRAREIIQEHHDKPFGTEIEFEDQGERYVARIEEHYHPPGGQARPWGHHPGVSVLVRRPRP